MRRRVCLYHAIHIGQYFPSSLWAAGKKKVGGQLIANMKKSTARVHFTLRSVLNQDIMCKVVDMVYTTTNTDIF